MKSVKKKKRKSKPSKKYRPLDPVMSFYSPSTPLGAISEKYYSELEQYIHKNVHRFGDPKSEKVDEFQKLVFMKYMHSLAHPPG